MKHLSFRIIFLCIFLPPVLYIFSMHGLESYLQAKYTAELEKILISDPITLLQGQITIQRELQRNIDTLLKSLHATKWGVLLKVTVRTKTGRWLYPSVSTQTFDQSSSGEFYQSGRLSSPEAVLQVAKENMEIMDEGISLEVALQIPNNTWLANGVLVFYIFLFAGILYGAYMKNARESEQLSLQNQEALEAASTRLEQAEQQLSSLVDKEKDYHQEIEKLRAEVAKTSDRLRDTEDEALTEIETLEEKVQESLSLRQEMELEVLRLKEEMERLESASKPSPKKIEKQVDKTMKRFTTLYKNLEFHPRAVEGYLTLRSDLQLRAEELIHNINEESDRLVVKRKVFARKGAMPTFETEFAYRGRLYWKRTSGGKVRVLALEKK
jgi:hypothetical protein